MAGGSSGGYLAWRAKRRQVPITNIRLRHALAVWRELSKPGHCPTYRELEERLNLCKETTLFAIDDLEAMGYLCRRGRCRNRAITVLVKYGEVHGPTEVVYVDVWEPLVPASGVTPPASSSD